MTRTGRKLLAAAALTTGVAASAGIAGANPNQTPVSATTAARVANPPDGCMLRAYDPVAKRYWYVGNGKNMPDQASIDGCKSLQAVLTDRARAAKASVQAPSQHVSREQWKKHITRLLGGPTTASVK